MYFVTCNICASLIRLRSTFAQAMASSLMWGLSGIVDVTKLNIIVYDIFLLCIIIKRINNNFIFSVVFDYTSNFTIVKS